MAKCGDDLRKPDQNGHTPAKAGLWSQLELCGLTSPKRSQRSPERARSKPKALSPAEVEVREDLPGGAWRLYSEAVGVHHVFINGEHAVRDGGFTDARPGTLLRSGRDTEPVSASG